MNTPTRLDRLDSRLRRALRDSESKRSRLGISRYLAKTKKYEWVYPAPVTGVQAVPLSQPPRVLLDDPRRGQWMVLDQKEYELYQGMDGSRSTIELLYRDMQNRGSLALEKLGQLLDRLARRGLVRGIFPRVGERLERALEARRRPFWTSLRETVGNGFRPLRHLGRPASFRTLKGLLRPLSSPLLLFAFALLALSGLFARLPRAHQILFDPIHWGRPVRGFEDSWTAYPLGMMVFLSWCWILTQIRMVLAVGALEGVPDHVFLLRIRLFGYVPTLDPGLRARETATQDSRVRSSILGTILLALAGSIGAHVLLLMSKARPDLLAGFAGQMIFKMKVAAFFLCFVELCPFLPFTTREIAVSLLGKDQPIRRSVEFLFRKLPGKILEGGSPTQLEKWYLELGVVAAAWTIFFFIQAGVFISRSVIPLLIQVLSMRSVIPLFFLGSILAALAVPVFASFLGVVGLLVFRAGQAISRSEIVLSPRVFSPVGVVVSLGVPLILFFLPQALYAKSTLALLALISAASPFVAMRISRYCRGSRLQSAFRYLSFYFVASVSAIPLLAFKLHLLSVNETGVKLFFTLDSLSFLFLFPFFLYVFVDVLGRWLSMAALAIPFLLTAFWLKAGFGIFLMPVGVTFLSLVAHFTYALLAFLCLAHFLPTPVAPLWLLLGVSFILSGSSRIPQYMAFKDQLQSIQADSPEGDQTAEIRFTASTRSICSGLALFALGSFLVGLRRLRTPPLEIEGTPGGSDSKRLLEAFCRMANVCIWCLGNHLGKGRALTILRILGQRSKASSLPIQLVGHRIHVDHTAIPAETDTVAAGLKLLAWNLFQGTRYLAGDTFLQKAFFASQDHLYWEESELLNHHVFHGEPWVPIPVNAALLSPEARQGFLGKIPLFSGLSPEDMQAVIGHIRQRRYPPEEEVVRQGEPGREFFVIQHGTAQVSLIDASGMEIPLAVLQEGDCFGEVALLEGVPRTATVRSMGTLTALVLTDKDFHALVSKVSQAHDRIVPVIRYGTFLSRVPLFADLPPIRLLALARRLKEERFNSGMDVITEGKQGDRFYLVKEGQLEILRRGEKIAGLGPGDYFGEIALLTNSPRTATVRTVTDGVLLSINKQDFYMVLSSYVATLDSLKEFANRRLYQLRASEAS